MLNLEPKHIKSKERIGKVNESPVWEVVTTGGLYMNIVAKGASFEVIGTGPHPAVARYIAEQKYPSLVWTKLSKSGWVDPADFMYLVPKYQKLTDEARWAFEKMQGLV